MTLQDIIGNHRGRLTPADHRLIGAILESPQRSALSSAAQIAAAAGLHAASVVRLAQKLGFAGFPELRAVLREEMLGGEPEIRVRRRLAAVSNEAVLESIVEGERAALLDLPRHVSQIQVRRAARWLARAKGIVVFGEGTARVVAEMAAQRLRRMGRPVLRPEAQPRELAEALCGLPQGGVLLAVVLHSMPALLPAVLGAAAKARARTIAVADVIGPTVRPAPDLLMWAPRGPQEETHSLTVPMAICNAVLLTLTTLDDGKAMSALERYGQLRRRLAGRDGGS